LSLSKLQASILAEERRYTTKEPDRIGVARARSWTG